ncbi:MAG: hypothetical protein ABEK00_03400 [Candidatus Nanohaloarchaea archaeon]
MVEEQEIDAGRRHREKIDSRQLGRHRELKSLVEEVKELSASSNQLKELSKKKRKEKIKEHIEEFRRDFEEPTYFVELSKRAATRLDGLSQDFQPEKHEILERIIRISLTHTNKTRPILTRELLLENKISEEIAAQEIGQDSVDELRKGQEKDIDVDL